MSPMLLSCSTLGNPRQAEGQPLEPNSQVVSNKGKVLKKIISATPKVELTSEKKANSLMEKVVKETIKPANSPLSQSLIQIKASNSQF